MDLYHYLLLRSGALQAAVTKLKNGCYYPCQVKASVMPNKVKWNNFAEVNNYGWLHFVVLYRPGLATVGFKVTLG